MGFNVGIRRFCKGIRKTSIPEKKASFWDAQDVLSTLEQLGTTENLPWNKLVWKTAFLIQITSGRHMSDLTRIALEDFVFNNDVSHVSLICTHPKVRNHKDLFILAYYPNSVLCLVATFQVYLEQRHTTLPPL